MQEYKDWDGNLLPDPAPTIEHAHIGDTIRVKTRKDNFENTDSIIEYEIIAIYPRIVLTKDKKTGFRRSFSYGDLLTMGMEYQGAEVEDMRATYGQDQKRENLTKKLSLFNPDYNPDNYKKGKRKMKTVEKKILPQYFRAVREEKKNFELRKDEDDVRPGDVLILMECAGGEYTGRTEVRRIRYVLREVPEYGLMPGYCIMGW